MNRINGTLSLRNPVQAAIFPEVVREMTKGHWSGSRPAAHADDWANAHVVVDPKHLGRDFDPVKANYDLLNKEVTERIAKRAIKSVKLSSGELISPRDVRRELRDLMFIMRTKRGHALATSHQGMMGRPGRPSRSDLDRLESPAPRRVRRAREAVAA